MSEEIKNTIIDEETEDIMKDDIFDDFDDFEDDKKKSVIDKIKDFGSGAVNKVKETGRWMKDHPDEAIERVTGVATVAGLGILTIAGIKGAKKLDRMDYSDEIGESVELKRKLKNKDKVELDYRVKTGQTKIEALSDMDLIK